jgi:hypothetical protein
MDSVLMSSCSTWRVAPVCGYARSRCDGTITMGAKSIWCTIACACCAKSSSCAQVGTRCHPERSEGSHSWSCVTRTFVRSLAVCATRDDKMRVRRAARPVCTRRARSQSKLRYFLTISAFSIMLMPSFSAILPFTVIVLPACSASCSFIGL